MGSVNPINLIPAYCRNCTHRFVCSIQENIRGEDTDVKKFNTDNLNVHQSVSSINYNCTYKTIDPTV